MKEKTNKAFETLDKQHYLQTFRRFPITLAKGKGSRVWDIEGKEYIDVLAGIAVNSVGHCHPNVVKAIQEQAAKLMHISNFYVSEPQAQLAERLTELSGLNRVFFSNSGAESVEGAIKLARKYGKTQGKAGTVISMEGCFHGRTLATIATGKKAMQNGFDPIPSGFKQAKFNDFESVAHVATGDVAAIIVEPVQGEGGINVADKAFLQQLRKLCDEKDIVLIFDEIQTGIGRTGYWFAKDHYGVQPDIMTLAKGLGGGVPIGAFLSSEKIAQAIEFGDHGTTFGGNPLMCAAALAVLQTVEEENLLHAAKEKGEWLKQQFADMHEPSIVKIKGLGLMVGVEFTFETKPLVIEMMHHGVLANATAGNVLRLVPPLNISYDELQTALEAMKKSLEAVKEHA